MKKGKQAVRDLKKEAAEFGSAEAFARIAEFVGQTYSLEAARKTVASTPTLSPGAQAAAQSLGAGAGQAIAGASNLLGSVVGRGTMGIGVDQYSAEAIPWTPTISVGASGEATDVKWDPTTWSQTLEDPLQQISQGIQELVRLGTKQAGKPVVELAEAGLK